MEKLKSYCKIIIQFLQCNIIKTIWFNLKMLPLDTAMKLPIYIQECSF